MDRQMAASSFSILSLIVGACALSAKAAVLDTQTVFVRELYFQARPLNKGAPCYIWEQSPSGDNKPFVHADSRGAYIELDLPYRRSDASCTFSLESKEDLLKDRAQDEGRGVLRIKARPPLAILRAMNGGLSEELLVETHLEELQDLPFFSFFERTLIRSELSWLRASSNDKELLESWVATWPVLKGSIEFPFPFWHRMETGLSLMQSLGRAGEQGLKLSSFSLRVSLPILGRYFSQPYSWSIGSYYQGSNFFQRDTDNPTFRLSALRSVGAWSRASASWRAFGLLLEGGYSVSGKGIDRVSESNWEAALTYRLRPNWGLVSGFERRLQVATRENEDGSKLNERTSEVFLGLQFMPFLSAKELSR
jgi:hypothetical protein